MEIKGKITNRDNREKVVILKVGTTTCSCFKNQMENFEKEVKEDFKYKEGDEISVTYEENKVGDKVYKNIKDIQLIKEAEKEEEPVRITETEEVKPHLKVHTIIANEAADFDSQINKFNSENDVEYTQTNLAVTSNSGAYQTILMATLYHR